MKTQNYYLQSIIQLCDLNIETKKEINFCKSIRDNNTFSELTYFASKLKIRRIQLIKEINKSILYLN